MYITRNEKDEKLVQTELREKIRSILDDYDANLENSNVKHKKQAITKNLVNGLMSGEEIYNLLQDNNEDFDRIVEYLSR
jgi:hypothetical protein